MKNMNFLDKLKRDNEQPKVQKMRKSHIPFRLNLLFFVIFGLFVSLIVRLGYLQIAEGEQFATKLQENSSQTITGSAPRGQIYDANGIALVSNQANLAIKYTRGKNVSAEDILKIANRVNQLANVPADELTERDKKDYWLANPEHLKAAQERLTDKDKTNDKGETITDESTLYAKTVEKVTPEEINFDESTMKAATIFKRMNSVRELNSAFIKNEGVTENELAVIGENSSEIPGVTTGMDWTRSYPQGNTLRSILGTVSSEKAGLPAEEAEEYLAKGYSMNDRVGTSYLEKQYEDKLQGKKSKSQLELDSKGKVVTQKLVEEGQKGSNLKLTIDLNFQKAMEDLVLAQYNQLLASGNGNYSDGVYVTVMNPKTGAIMAMVSYDHDTVTGEVKLNNLASINKAFVPGSVVKGATLAAGYENGVISGNDQMVDQPIYLGGSEVKSSYFNRTGQIPISAEQALEYSSNSYMMQIVIKMLGTIYTPNMTLPYSVGDDKVFNELRSTYGEFGLGVSTGVDLPGEETGLVPSDFDNPERAPNGGNLLDLSFGQFDTYTSLQLAQYVSTVANGGQRIAPHVVQGIYGNKEDGTLGDLIEEIQPNVLNKVNISDAQLKIIQNGFYQVAHGTSGLTTAPDMRYSKMDVAVKTGTAETSVSVDGVLHDTVSSNIIGYAPFNDPEIAVSVILPNITSEQTKPNQQLARAIFDLYSDMYITNQQ